MKRMIIYLLIAIAGIFGQLALCGILGFRKTFPHLLRVDMYAVLLVLAALLLCLATC